MNGFEFLFALTTVIGMTMLHLLWLGFAYRLKEKAINLEDKTKEKRVT